MQIFYENTLKKLTNIIFNNAKFQKVLLIYDNSISLFDINLLYNNIKHLCIFNKMDIHNIDEEEVFNGYKLIVYYCSGLSLLSVNFDKQEFINVYIPTDNILMPVLYNNSHILHSNSYLLMNKQTFDENTIISINFNKFFYSLSNFISLENQFIEFNLLSNEDMNITNINKLPKSMYLIDIDILKTCKLQYKELWVVDLILINAFITLICSINENNLSIVDAYKSAKSNVELLDKIYANANNISFINIIKLNYQDLMRIALCVKSKILQFVYNPISENKFLEILNKVKLFCKNSDSILTFLYTFNIFNS